MNTATWKKTKGGEWVVLAPVSVLRAGGSVTVTAKSGTTKTVTIARVGRAFSAAGAEMAYGYPATEAAESNRLAPTYSQRARATASRRTHKCVTDGNCSSFGNGRSCGADDCDGW